MTDRTTHDRDLLSEDDREVIEQALDQWEAMDASERDSDLAVYCPDARLLPHFAERVHELQQIAKFAINPTSGSIDEAPLTSIGPIEIEETISRRSTCNVYKGTQANPKRNVAVKVLKQGFDDPKYAKRFAHEVRLLAKLRHTSIAEIYFAGEFESKDQSLSYFAMEYVDGPVITDYAAQNGLSISERVALFLPVCEAVGHAHQRGVIHRDLKPTNVLATSDGVPKVLDFGIAKSIDPTDADQTHFGAGTPSYMSPEQFDTSQGQSVHTDIYSLGVMLFELIAGHLPYRQPVDSMAQAAKVICSGDLLDTRECDSEFPPDLDAIIRKCLEQRPEDRYQGVPELVRDLDCFLSGRAVSARPLSSFETLARWIGKNRAASFSILIAVVSVLAGCVTSLFYWQRAEGVVTVLNATIDELDAARGRSETARGIAETARDELEKELDRSRRSAVNNVLALADRHWQSDPDLVDDWLEALTEDESTAESFAWRIQRDRANRIADEIKVAAFPIVDVAYASDSNLLVAASETGVVSVWDLHSRSAVWQKEMGRQDVRGCDVDPQQERVLVVDDKDLVLVDLLSGETLRRVPSELPYVVDAMFSPAYDFIVAYGDSDRLSIWTSDLAARPFEFEASLGGMHAVAIAPDSARVSVVGKNGRVVEWPLADAGPNSAFKIPAKNLACAAIASDLDGFAAAEKFVRLSVYAGDQTASPTRYANRRSRFDSIFFSADNEWLISQGRRQIHGRDRASGWNVQWSQRVGASVRSVRPTRDANLFAVGYFDGRVQLRWVTPPATDEVLASKLSRPRGLCLSPKADRVVVVGDSVTSVSLKSDGDMQVLSDLKASCFDCALHANGVLDVASGKRKRLFRLNSDSGEWIPILNSSHSVTSVIVDESQHHTIAGLGGGEIVVLKSDEPASQSPFRGHEQNVSALALAPTGDYFVSASSAGELAIWNNDKVLRCRSLPHDHEVSGIAISSDGRLVYSVCHGGKLVMTDSFQELPSRERLLMADRIHAIAISPDDQTLAVGGSDGNIYLLDAITSELQATLTAHADSVTGVCFGPDGDFLLSISIDGTLRRWNATW